MGLWGVGAATVMLVLTIGVLIPTSCMHLSEKVLRHGSPLHPDISLVFEGNLKQWSEILPILKSFDVRAIFFSNPPSGEDEKKMVSQILEDGHQCYMPVNSSATGRVYHAVPAQGPEYQKIYYPKSSWLSLYQFWKWFRMRYPVVLWSLTWNVSRRNGRKEMRFVRNGSIVRVKGRPADVQQFAAVLQWLKQSGFRFCTLAQLARRFRQEKETLRSSRSAVNRFVFYAWKRWESFLHSLLNMEYVCTPEYERTLFRVRKRSYYGRPLPLSDGEWLRRGEPIVELHLNNDMFAQVIQQTRSSVHLATTLIRLFRRSLPELSRHLADHPKYEHVKAVYGITLMYRGADPFGFSVSPVPKRWWTRLLTFYLRLYLSVMHPDGRKRLMIRRDKLVPKRVFMPASKLFSWYPPNGVENGEPVPSHGHNMEVEVRKGGATRG